MYLRCTIFVLGTLGWGGKGLQPPPSPHPSDGRFLSKVLVYML